MTGWYFHIPSRLSMNGNILMIWRESISKMKLIMKGENKNSTCKGMTKTQSKESRETKNRYREREIWIGTCFFVVPKPVKQELSSWFRSVQQMYLIPWPNYVIWRVLVLVHPGNPNKIKIVHKIPPPFSWSFNEMKENTKK